jgi:hypothetical protein
MTSFYTGKGISDTVFQPTIALDQFGWFNNSVLYWSTPSTRPISFTLVMEYDPADVNRQQVSIDRDPGTPGLTLDDTDGLIVTGGLAVVWKGWVGKSPHLLVPLLSHCVLFSSGSHIPQRNIGMRITDLLQFAVEHIP